MFARIERLRSKRQSLANPRVIGTQHKLRPILWIVVPCYNEQEVLPVTAPLFLLAKIQQLIADGKITDQSVVCFVDDGSSDKTWNIIQDFAKQDFALCRDFLVAQSWASKCFVGGAYGGSAVC